MIDILLVLALSFPGTASAVQSPLLPNSSICARGHLPDSDADGLADACEAKLAERFAPVFIVREGGCSWDDSASRIRGGYVHGVQPADSVIRIAYLPAYYRDCGWRGMKCWLPWVDCSPHNGDSEIVIVEVRERAEDFEMSGIFLSAHCFGTSTGSCRWFRGNDLDDLAWEDSAPVVWVAEGRNANYPSSAACDAGHHSIDTCDRNAMRYRFPVEPRRNIGSRGAPLSADGCVSAAEMGLTGAAPAAVECFWTDVPFRGWRGEGKGVTPYNRYLGEIARF